MRRHYSTVEIKNLADLLGWSGDSNVRELFATMRQEHQAILTLVYKVNGYDPVVLEEDDEYAWCRVRVNDYKEWYDELEFPEITPDTPGEPRAISLQFEASNPVVYYSRDVDVEFPVDSDDLSALVQQHQLLLGEHWDTAEPVWNRENFKFVCGCGSKYACPSLAWMVVTRHGDDFVLGAHYETDDIDAAMRVDYATMDKICSRAQVEGGYEITVSDQTNDVSIHIGGAIAHRLGHWIDKELDQCGPHWSCRSCNHIFSSSTADYDGKCESCYTPF